MSMKLGIGFHREMATRDNFKFARQAGCTHVVVHLVDRFKGRALPDTDEYCWGMTRAGGRLWSEDELRGLKKAVSEEGLVLEALENIDPSFWSDVLLDGPRKAEQLANLKVLVRRMGKVGIPILGYNFSIAGVWGRVEGPFARGGAISAGFTPPHETEETPIPKGQLANLVYDPDAPPGEIDPVTPEQLWGRLEEFLQELVPVAEECGVRLAAHPDDPPMPTLRGHARLVYQPHFYQRLLDLAPSRANALEFCVGTLQEMSEGDLYQSVDGYSRQGAIAYVHLRNVRGKVPDYREVFIDEGDVDVIRVLRILHRNGYEGVLIPDHAPRMHCDGSWHAGFAHALGYMRAALQVIESEA